jgi:hypothetical protein
VGRKRGSEKIDFGLSVGLFENRIEVVRLMDLVGWRGRKKEDDELLMSAKRNDYHFSGRSPSLQSASGMDGKWTDGKNFIKTKD